MKIITKYYDRNGKLKILKGNNDKPSNTIRFKLLRNGKEFPCCDFEGKCTNKAYAEVYPKLMNKKGGWSYLCKKHYKQEQKRLNQKLPACFSIEW